MFTKILTGSILALAMAMTSAQAEDRVIRIGTEGAYAPFNLINDNGEIDGFERELGDMICENAGLKCEWVQNDWDSIIPNLLSGNYDVIMAGMSITDEREKVIDFSIGYFPPEPSAFVALSGHEIDFNNDIFTAQTATIQASYLADKGVELIEFPSPDQTIAAVKNGEADVVLADKAFLQEQLNAMGNEMEFVGDDVAIGGGIGAGVRESDSELREILSAEIQKLKDDGTLQKLLDKWFEGKVKLQ